MSFRKQIFLTTAGCGVVLLLSAGISIAAGSVSISFPQTVQPMMLSVSEFLFVVSAFAFLIGVFARLTFRFVWFAGLNACAEGDCSDARMFRLTYLTGPTAFIWRWIMHVDHEGRDRDAPN